MGFKDDAIRILIEYRDKVHGGNYSAAANALGIQPPTFWRWLNGGQLPRLTSLSIAFDALNARVSLPSAPAQVPDAGFELVRAVEAVAGAGESLETGGETTGHVAFRKTELKKRGVKAKNCVVMRVRGESMQPLIRDGDTILVDQSQTEPRDGGIYCIGLGDALMVKRLQRIPSGWNLCSENPTSPPVPVTHGDLDQLRIYGRVKWFGRFID